MRFFLVISGTLVIVVSVVFFMWFSAMGGMSTTAIACHRNDFFTEEAICLFYIPVFFGIILIISGVKKQ